MGKMVLVSLDAPALFGMLAGALFGLCWAYRRAALSNWHTYEQAGGSRPDDGLANLG